MWHQKLKELLPLPNTSYSLPVDITTLLTAHNERTEIALPVEKNYIYGHTQDPWLSKCGCIISFTHLNPTHNLFSTVIWSYAMPVPKR